MANITIAIIEDQEDVSENLFRVISESLNFSCVSQHTSAEEALRCINLKPADIYLVDLGLYGVSGIEFIEKARMVRTDSDFIVHTISESGRDLLDALSVGAVGYIVKGCSDQELIDGLSIVAQGGGLISPRMARHLSRYFQAIGPQRKTLTRTEADVLQKLKTGMTYGQIADANHVSRSTIQSHIKNIYKKLNVKTRDDAVKTGVLFGWITS